MSKIPRRAQPTVTQSVAVSKTKTPPLKPQDAGMRQSQRPKQPEQRQGTSPRPKPSPAQPAQKKVEIARKPAPAESPQRKAAASPKLAKARAEAAARANADVFEESERIRKEMDSEFGGGPTEKDLKMEWMDKVEALQKELNDNFKEEVAIDTNVMTTFDEAAKQVKPTNDVFKTTTKMMEAGFDALHEKMAREKELLQKRMALIGQMRDEMMMHGADDYMADLEPDDDGDLDDDPPPSPSPQPPKGRVARK